MADKECSNCRFWESRFNYLDCEKDDSRAEEFKHFGMCKRYPPKVCVHDHDISGFDDYNGDATDFFEFPVTKEYSWCGEWKKIKTPNA